MLVWYAKDNIYGTKMERSQYQWVSDSEESDGFYDYFKLIQLTGGSIIGRVDLRPRAYPKGFDPRTEAESSIKRLAEKLCMQYEILYLDMQSVFVIS